MILRKQKGNQCILYSLSMCIDIKPEELVIYARHDGSDVSRTFNIEEFVSYLYNRNFSAIPFVSRAEYCGEIVELLNQPPLHLRGVLIYGKHAVAWDGKNIYDPHGKIYPLIQGWDVFWLIDHLELITHK